jgi:hypothetical protein
VIRHFSEHFIDDSERVFGVVGFLGESRRRNYQRKDERR